MSVKSESKCENVLFYCKQNQRICNHNISVPNLKLICQKGQAQDTVYNET